MDADKIDRFQTLFVETEDVLILKAQSLNHIQLDKCKELCLDPQNPHKKHKVANACNPGACRKDGRWRQVGHWKLNRLLASSSLVRLQTNERLCLLKQKVEGVLGDSQGRASARESHVETKIRLFVFVGPRMHSAC